MILPEDFFLADISIPFFTFGSADIRFAEKELVWGTYMAAEALPTTKWLQLFSAKEFAVAALVDDDKAFVARS